MNKIMYLIITTLFFYTCSNNQKGKLLFVESNTENGSNYPYFMFIPDGTSVDKELMIIVEPNNSGFVDDDLKKQNE